MIIKVMKFDSTLPFPKRCPGKNRQTQINHHGIQQIEWILKLDTAPGSNRLALLQQLLDSRSKCNS